MGNCNKPIGVFDSGLGGISVLKELVNLMPNEDFIYFGDSFYAPYGVKQKEEILERCLEICDFLVREDVKAIVIACNTATSVAVNVLRDTYKHIPIIGMEPALKVAAENVENANIIVMATTLTLNEEKFNNLMKRYSDKNNIIKMPCPELVNIVENDNLDDIELINSQINEYCRDVDLKTIDTIVLGCTHFVFYKEHLKKIVDNKTSIIDGNNGTARHLKKILEIDGAFNSSDSRGDVMFFNSCPKDKYIELSKKLFLL